MNAYRGRDLRTTRVIRIALLLAVLGHKVDAQTASPVRGSNDDAAFTLLDRPTHFAIAWPQNAMYEADLMIPVHLFSRTAALRSWINQDVTHRSSDCMFTHRQPRLRARRAGDSAPSTKWVATGCTLKLIPHFTIRQLTSESSPVRTPTFNPGLEFNWYALRTTSRVPRDTLDPHSHPWLFAVHGRVAHYSNGQSGCLFAVQQRAADGDECRPAGGPDEPLNTNDGSFSTHYGELGLTIGRLGFSERKMVWRDNELSTVSLAARHYPGGWVSKILAWMMSLRACTAVGRTSRVSSIAQAIRYRYRA